MPSLVVSYRLHLLILVRIKAKLIDMGVGVIRTYCLPCRSNRHLGSRCSNYAFVSLYNKIFVTPDTSFQSHGRLIYEANTHRGHIKSGGLPCLVESSASCGLTHDYSDRETCGKGVPAADSDDSKPTNIQIQPLRPLSIQNRENTSAPNGWLDRDIGVAGDATTTNKQTWLFPLKIPT